MENVSISNCNIHLHGDVYISCGKKPKNDFPVLGKSSTLPIELQELYDQMSYYDYGNISVVGDGILRFESVEHYEQVSELLENACEEWNSLFEGKYGHLDTNKYEEFCEACHYDEFYPIVVFEQKYGVFGKMLFDKQKMLVEKWEENNCQTDYPGNEIFILESEQAIHNIYNEVCIDTTVYQFRKTCEIKVPISKIDDWIAIRTLPDESITDPFIVNPINNIVVKDSGDVSSFKGLPVYRSGKIRAKHGMPMANNEYTFWEASIRSTLAWEWKMTCKIINYHQVIKNNEPKTVRFRRKCTLTPSATFCDEIYYRGSEHNESNLYERNPWPKQVHVLKASKMKKSRSETIKLSRLPVPPEYDIVYGTLIDETFIKVIIDGRFGQFNIFTFEN